MVSTGTQQRTPSSEVVATVAEAEGVQPLDLPPIFDVIEPEALDSILTSAEGTTEIVFEYHGHVVTVTSQSGDRIDVHASAL